MAFREIDIMDIWEVIRRWHDHHSISQIAKALGYDRHRLKLLEARPLTSGGVILRYGRDRSQ